MQQKNKQNNQIDLKDETVEVLSLGCSRNLVDSEKILIDLKRRGACISSLDKPSIVVINTCAFTQNAKMDSIQAISDCIKLKKEKKIKKIFVHGCLSERYPNELKKSFKEVDSFSGIAGFKKVFDPEAMLAPGRFAYLKISEGCSSRCSFCAIPFIKGGLRSRKVSEILDEVRFLEDQGIVELNIIGQDTTLFGMDRPSGFKKNGEGGLELTRLVEKILKVSRLPWIRLFYLHPLRVTGDLIDLIAHEKRVCSYVDLPLQHINDRILKLMNRGVNRDFVERLITNIRSKIKDVTLRTTFIVGFPSEKKSEFAELSDFVEKTRFEKLGVITYSREEGTKAYHFKNQLVEKVKKERYDILMSLQRKISSSILSSYRGSITDVLIKEEQKGVQPYAYIGRSRRDAPDVDGRFFLRSKKPLKRGCIVRARIDGSSEYDLSGEAL